MVGRLITTQRIIQCVFCSLGILLYSEMRSKKILKKVLRGSKNIRFEEFVYLIECFGFVLDRKSGSHNIYKHNEIEEMMNIQNFNGEAKPYQIKQFLSLLEKYDLNIEDN